MSARGWLALVPFAVLCAVVARADVQGPQGVTEVDPGGGSGTGGYELVFASSANIADGSCLRADSNANLAGVACTTNDNIVHHAIAIHTGETPTITRFA